MSVVLQNIHIPTVMSSSLCTYVCMSMHIPTVHTYVDAVIQSDQVHCVCLHPYTYIHVYIHVYIHTCVHTCVHTLRTKLK